jgi:hypothetical protein
MVLPEFEEERNSCAFILVLHSKAGYGKNDIFCCILYSVDEMQTFIKVVGFPEE